jgi:hypothetical protein
MGRHAVDKNEDPGVKAIRDAIARWRLTREKRTRMPAELWSWAVRLARTHGTYRMARTLQVNYEALARRVAETGGEPASETKGGGFVELRGADLLGEATVIELSEVDGTRMTIRLGAGSALDAAAALVSAFRRRGA